ncbi:S41 family peptidase [Streptomyces sp. NPDC058297]|uniref:S41 family peptidase n=1 Tax=Streptomyces sp. NPDC058297 TaxID=3346433 RepID=UPI0036ED8CDC
MRTTRRITAVRDRTARSSYDREADPTMRTRILPATVAASALMILTGCDTPPNSANPGTAAPSVQGVWQMDGYGTAVAVSGHRLTMYDTTSVSCLPGNLAGDQQGGTGQNGSLRYLASAHRLITVTPQSSYSARLRIASNAGPRTLRRIPALPDACSKKPSADPRKVFDVFWQTYAENYPFFAAKHVDWQAVRDRYRPRINKDTSDGELFAVLRKMIEPLHDAHTELSDGKDRAYSGERPGTPPHSEQDLARIDRAVATAVGMPLRSYANGALSFGRLPEGTGYLRITRFISLTDEPSYVKWEAELDAALKAIPWERLRGLIVDVRANSGGADPLGLRVLSRLTGQPYTAYTKFARNDPRDPALFTPGQPITVRPYTGPRFTGPLAVLTGPLTISAGESFTQALMERAPAPIRIGQNTQGVFSDTMDRALPNGWRFILPNEEYRRADGTTFDGPGIPPQHRTPVFTEKELDQGRDSALAKARELLHR